MRIICLKGRRNSGKTTSLKMLYELLKPNAEKITDFSDGNDIIAVLSIRGKKIAIISAGDTKTDIENGFNKVKLSEPDCVICASHVKGETLNFVRAMSEDIYWICVSVQYVKIFKMTVKTCSFTVFYSQADLRTWNVRFTGLFFDIIIIIYARDREKNMKNYTGIINVKDKKGYINPEIYGHFTEHLGRCVYEGIYVGENSEIPNIHGIRKDVVEALKNIKASVVRWPGGCFADEYHWRDGIGPKENRKQLKNNNWGGVIEDNSFGTHEFMEFCELIGAQPYVNGNVGSGTVREMSEWVEYMTLKEGTPTAGLRQMNGRDEPWRLKYLGIGNESWGCGGNMKAQDYARDFRKYSGFCKDHSGNRLYKIACGPNSADYQWMEDIMKNLTDGLGEWLIGGVDLHYYTMPIWPDMDSATDFDDNLYYKTVEAANFADELLARHIGIMDRYDPGNKIGLIMGEWGCWHQVQEGTNPGFLYQQNCMRDAIVAAVELNIFNRHSRRLVMANLAQMVNVLQSVLLTEGRKMIKTPTYHVFDLFKNHQGGEAVYCFTENENCREGQNTPLLSSSASVKDNTLTVTLSNTSLSEECVLNLSLYGFSAGKVSARILTNDARAYNSYEDSERVHIEEYRTESAAENMVSVKLPPCSVVELGIEASEAC